MACAGAFFGLCRPRTMSRLLLQTGAAVANATASPTPSPPSNGSPGKSGVIYTFTFIGATVLVGLVFLCLMFRYILKYRYFRGPVRTPLQASFVHSSKTFCGNAAWLLLNCLTIQPAGSVVHRHFESLSLQGPIVLLL